jgi:phytanoyl-CoA hydroxylase
MLTNEQIERFHRDGFLRAVPALTAAETRALRARLDEVLAGRSVAQPEAKRNLLGDDAERVVIQVVNIWEADDLFERHLYNPVICGMVARLMATNTVRVWHDQVQVKPAKIGGPTDWHQDHPYWPVIQPADLVSAWVALDDADEENGCMWMVPGSHRWGPHKGGTIGTNPDDFRPAPDLSLLPEGIDVTPVPCPVRAGEVMFHHCLTWHGSPPNHSERARPGIAVHYMPGHTRYVPHGSHLVERRITVEPGEILSGEFFPTVWDRGPIAPPIRGAA